MTEDAFCRADGRLHSFAVTGPEGGRPFVKHLPLNGILKEGTERQRLRNRRDRKVRSQTAVCESRQASERRRLLGYARVSKGDEQNNTLQARALRTQRSDACPIGHVAAAQQYKEMICRGVHLNTIGRQAHCATRMA